MNDMSITITPLRAASMLGTPSSANQFCRPHDSCSTFGSTPCGAYQSAPSQPLTSLK